MSSERVQLGAGGGGALQRQLLERLYSWLGPEHVAGEDDGYVFTQNAEGSSVITTDSFVINPLEFPGGDIGKLAICGTLNDLAVMGARPSLLSLALIIEEGLPLDLLERMVVSAGREAAQAGVRIVTGDTKVVPRGAADQLFINTTGYGIFPPGRSFSASRIKPGQRLLLSGTLGDHSMAVMLCREGMDFRTELASDCANLSGMIEELVEAIGAEHISAMRDLTRGGLAAVLNEFALSAEVDLVVEEASLPVSPAVRSAGHVLGIDPIEMANEGKLLVVVDEEAAHDALAVLRAHELGRQAALIGEVTEYVRSEGGVTRPRRPLVFCQAMAGRRVIDFPLGELLPRIC